MRFDVDIDGGDFAVGILIVAALCIVAFLYFGIGAVIADILSLKGFAWYMMTMAWPIVIGVLWAMIAGLFAILRR